MRILLTVTRLVDNDGFCSWRWVLLMMIGLVTVVCYRNRFTNYALLQRATCLWPDVLASSARFRYSASISISSMSVRAKVAAFRVSVQLALTAYEIFGCVWYAQDNVLFKILAVTGFFFVKTSARCDWPGIHRSVAVECFVSFSRMMLKISLFLVSAKLLRVEQRWNFTIEYMTNSVGWSVLRSFNTWWWQVSLSTAVAAAKGSAV